MFISARFDGLKPVLWKYDVLHSNCFDVHQGYKVVTHSLINDRLPGPVKQGLNFEGTGKRDVFVAFQHQVSNSSVNHIFLVYIV